MTRRYEDCKVCGKSWNVSLDLVLPKHGYICPHCYYQILRLKKTS